jgi:hypothetical protein
MNCNLTLTVGVEWNAEPFTFKGIIRLKVKGWQRIFHINGNPKREVAMVISNKISPK